MEQGHRSGVNGGGKVGRWCDQVSRTGSNAPDNYERTIIMLLNLDTKQKRSASTSLKHLVVKVNILKKALCILCKLLSLLMNHQTPNRTPEVQCDSASSATEHTLYCLIKCSTSPIA